MGEGTIPAPGPQESADRFRLRIAVMIALVSIAGALIAARASVLSVTASDLDQLSMQQLVQEQQVRAEIEGQISQDLRLFGRYQEHVLSWRLLERDADAVRSRRPELAERLDAEARAERSVARSLRAFFTFTPDLGDEEGRVEYDPGFVRRHLLDTSVDLADLRPDETFRRAQTLHVQIVRLIGVVALLIASLFFFTMAQLTGRGARRIFARSGTAVLGVGLALFVVVEVLAR